MGSVLKFRKWFKYGLKAQKLQKQYALKVSCQNKAPSLFLNPYCQRILVKVYAVMLDEQRERASGSQLVRCAGLETARLHQPEAVGKLKRHFYIVGGEKDGLAKIVSQAA